MPKFSFPNPRHSTSDGIVALGGDLAPERVMAAYQEGIFPWPIEGLPLAWFCPPKRAILEFDRIHLSRSLAKTQKKSNFRFSIDQAFCEVITACADSPRPGQSGTWITPEMKEAYLELHQRKLAHSIEVWSEDQLVGGIYGIDAGGAFSGESMFYRKPNASKLAILYLMNYLHTRGLSWLDIQVLTPHLEALGAREIERNEFLLKLKNAQKTAVPLF